MPQWFGVRVEPTTAEKAQKTIEHFLSSDSGHQVVTLNPEMLLAARKNKEFAQTLQQADLITYDGFGLVLMGGGEVKERLTGNDVLEMLFLLAQKNGSRILLLGGEGDQAIRAAEKVHSRFSNLVIKGNPGGQIVKEADGWRMDNDVMEEVRSFAPSILAVALGHEKQEMWIRDHLHHLPSVRVAVGIGGALAFLADDIRRAPSIMRKLGFEWLWRLVCEPRRIGRIFRAVVTFPILALSDKMKQL